jgi:hypothetical protein
MKSRLLQFSLILSFSIFAWLYQLSKPQFVETRPR